MCSFEVSQVVVVSVDDGVVDVPNEVGLSNLEGVDNSEKFFIVYISILLCCIECVKEEGNWVQFILLVSLLEDHSYCISEGITVYDEGVIKMWLLKNRSRADCVLQCNEGFLIVLVPIKPPSSCAVGNQHIEGCS